MTEGSSPLARGLRGERGDGGRQGRIIPARAGFTSATARTRPPSRDHPRSRGVYHQPAEDRRGRGGSSPLARGLRRRCAPPPSPTLDHPRSRGVYTPASTSPSMRAGSSPLARGLPPRLRRIVLIWRIIPARAGFTRESGLADVHLRDHPRSRGVYDVGSPVRPPPAGSSPLARGLPARLRAHRAALGIIPARAGFTLLGTR